MSKNLDETSPRKERSGYERSEEKDYKELQRAEIAPRLADSSAMLLPGSECLGILCSLIAMEKREHSFTGEFEVKGKTEERIVWRGQRVSLSGKEKGQICWCCPDQR